VSAKPTQEQRERAYALYRDDGCPFTHCSYGHVTGVCENCDEEVGWIAAALAAEAERARAEEREACALTVEALAYEHQPRECSAGEFAAAIRARSEGGKP
jgi:hypothetical protein